MQKCNNELSFVLLCFKYHGDAKILENLIREYVDKGRIGVEAGNVLETHLDMKLSERISSEDRRMCKGWREIEQRLEQQGIIKGEIRGEKNGIKKGMEKGMERGMEKGMEKGRKAGIKVGRKEGKADGEKTTLIAVISNALKNNLPIDVIKQITGFTTAKLKKFSVDNGIELPSGGALGN